MSNNEVTPFVIDFKPKSNNYGTATTVDDASSDTSLPSGRRLNKNNNNNNNNNNLGNQTPSTLYCLHGRKKIEVRDHCHRQRSEGIDVTARKKLIIASVLCLFFMICEIIGGYFSNSLAIATDAAHLLTDFASFMISLFAIWIAGRPSTQRMSFGWYRAEVIGALASVIMIWVITGILVWLAVCRIIDDDYDVNATIMLITSGVAILVNIIMGWQLQHGHSHGGHGHSHGGQGHANMVRIASETNLKSPELTAPSHSKTVTIDDPITPTNNAADDVVCPISPTERLENGVGDLAGSDAELPASGIRTYSYQNSQMLHTDTPVAAIMAETSPGAHHHGGRPQKEAVNMNVRAAYIHVIGDMVQSIGVFLAALLIYFKPDWAIADPICTFIFSIIVLYTTFSIMKDALLVLMEGTPTYLHYTEVLEIFQKIPGVERVHNLRIWALSINKVALSVHLAIAPGADPKRILQEATKVVHLRYNFFETTIQIEDFTPQMENCNQCTVPIS